VTFDWRGRRLVGIVGPIGAGKSSILDGIAFALYGKTPGVGSATRSLIHQLCDEAHVALTFQVDGETWRAIRAPRRKGQSGHQLLRLASGDAGAETLETITQEGPVNERVERLLGMDFQTFCRSVLLAQNRFSDFLKATRTERDKVLKGVFGYERLDAAKAAAERRLDRESVALESLARERTTIDEARRRLDDARTRAQAAEREVKAIEGAAPEMARLDDERSSAEADAAEVAQQLERLEQVAATLPPGERVDALLSTAADAHDDVSKAREALAAAEAARAACDAELASVLDRFGDRAQLRSFEQLVERHESLARDVRREAAQHAEAVVAVEAAGQGIEAAKATAAEVANEERSMDAALAEAAAATGEAREALGVAQHAEMAHELRTGLEAGEPCPVCSQIVSSVPRQASSAKAVAAAARVLAKAERDEAAARTARERVAASLGSTATALTEAERRHAEALERAAACERELRAAEAALTSVQDQLADRLGEGEPRALVEARASELATAEEAVERASSNVEEARRELEAIKERAADVGASMHALANELAAAWGALSAPRAIEAGVEPLRAAYVATCEAVTTRLDERRRALADAAGRDDRAGAAIGELLVSLGLAPDADFVAERAGAAARLAAATGAIEELEAQIARSSELEREVLQAEARRSLAQRLADDLRPSKFLAFLLEEERSELAELGSGLFETLTDGGYRFAAGDSFDVLDLNAADRTRKADSLSGGETFLASLALALALAEMVARGGGRLDAFFLDEGFGSLDPQHLERAMAGIERLVAEDEDRLVVLVSHVEQMRESIEDLIVLEKHELTGDTVVAAGAARA
jgi:exonuclease SbcC